jgi:hypothetical protein
MNLKTTCVLFCFFLRNTGDLGLTVHSDCRASHGFRTERYEKEGGLALKRDHHYYHNECKWALLPSLNRTRHREDEVTKMGR